MKILSNKKYEELNDRLSTALYDANLLRCELEVRTKRAEELITERNDLKAQIELLKNENELLKEKIKELKEKNKELFLEIKKADKEIEELKEVKKTTRTRRTKKEA